MMFYTSIKVKLPSANVCFESTEAGHNRPVSAKSGQSGLSEVMILLGSAMSETNVTQALQEFVGAFEVVFRYDWDYTQV